MILLNPGPVNVSERVRTALLRDDICHREEEFSSLLRGIQSKLIQAFAHDQDYRAIVVSCSGTAAVEAAITSATAPGKKILVIKNGVYGERIAEIAQAYRLGRIELSFHWTHPPPLDQIEAALNDDPSIQIVAMVHHETTTGLRNPVKEIGELVHRYGKVFLVDAVSAIAGETIDVAESHIDILAGTAGKCIQGFPGVSFLLVRDALMEAMRSYPKRSVFLHLPSYCHEFDASSVPFTPAVQIHYAFHEALIELLDEGVNRRIDRYHRASRFLRARFHDLGLDCLVPEEHGSNTITAVRLPSPLTYLELHDQLKARGFVIYAGQRALYSDIFRVANMGALTHTDFQGFVSALEHVCDQKAARNTE